MNRPPATIPSGLASDRRAARAKRIVQVKFVGLPIREMAPEVALREKRASGLRQFRAFLSRVIDRLVAARP